MPITRNLCMYKCDRDGKTEVLDESSSQAGRWRTYSFTRANQTTSDVLLCPDCADRYVQTLAAADTIFDTFMGNIRVEAGKHAEDIRPTHIPETEE